MSDLGGIIGAESEQYADESQAANASKYNNFPTQAEFSLI